MIKTVEIIVIIALLIFSFFLGVKYSDSIKSRMSWLETQDEQEVELPDLSNETNELGNAPDEILDPSAPMINENVEPNTNQPNVPNAPQSESLPLVQPQIAPAPSPAPSQQPPIQK